MSNLDDPLDRIYRIQWLTNIGSTEPNADVVCSLEDLPTFIESDPARFFRPPYTDPYESMCVADHKAADALRGTLNSERARAIATQAYLASWEHLPHPEVCGLISDDAETIAMLLLSGGPLSSFTQERLAWYEKGRAPWGYEGEYPNGRWLIL